MDQTDRQNREQTPIIFSSLSVLFVCEAKLNIFQILVGKQHHVK